jgi:CBS domain-containing protein
MNVITFLTPKAQVAWLYDDFTIRQGVEKLRNLGYTAIPVLNREGYYMGSVSEGDFLRSILDGGDNGLRKQERLPLKSIVRPEFLPAVSIRVTMEELMERAMAQSYIPVVDDRGVFIGIVTRQTIMRKLALPNLEVMEPNTQLA